MAAFTRSRGGSIWAPPPSNSRTAVGRGRRIAFTAAACAPISGETASPATPSEMSTLQPSTSCLLHEFHSFTCNRIVANYEFARLLCICVFEFNGDVIHSFIVRLGVTDLEH